MTGNITEKGNTLKQPEGSAVHNPERKADRGVKSAKLLERLKIVYLITGLSYGGAETQLVRLLTHLKATRKWDITVITMLPPEAYVDELASAGIPVATLNMKRGVPDPRTVLRLAITLQQLKPDVVHSFMVHANILARITKLLYRTPSLVCSARNTFEGSKWRLSAYRLTDSLADITTQVSQEGAKRYLELGAISQKKLRVISNGVDTAKFKPDLSTRKRLRAEFDPADKDKFTWIAVGRLEEQKDYPCLLQVFSALLNEWPNTSLLIVGDGPLRDMLHGMTREMELTETVRFLGISNDIPALLSVADAFVMSSAWEGMSNALLEASSAGLPAVATDVGGNSEIVVDGDNGYVVQARSAQTLSVAMQNLMALSNEKRVQMGLSGRARVEKLFSLNRMADLWEALYAELLVKKNKKSDAGERG